MHVETADNCFRGRLTGARLRAHKMRQFENSAHVLGGMLDTIIDARKRPNRWKTLPKRQGVILRGRQVELLGREAEILNSIDILTEEMAEETRACSRPRTLQTRVAELKAIRR